MNASKFTKAELEDYIETLEERVEGLKDDLATERETWEAIIDKRDAELDAMQCDFRAAFEEGYNAAWDFVADGRSGQALECERAWLTSQTRREHGAGE